MNKEIKLGVAYNVFDGEELLEYSIKQIREFASVLVVVYQKVSNFGNENPNLMNTLNDLKERGLIDGMFEYKPTFNYELEEIEVTNGLKNELIKRNVGLDICRANGCNVFMTIDCDELYDKKEFEVALDRFYEGNYDTSFCQMLSYYKLPTMQIEPAEKYFVPLFCKLNKNTKFEKISDYPVITDPTRRVKAGYPLVFSRNEIQMYHYSYVRKDLKSKLANTSSQMDKKSQEAILYHFNSWKKKEDGVFLLTEDDVKLKEVPNKFNIKI